MVAKIIRIPAPRRKRETVSRRETAALAAVLAEVRALRRVVERIEKTAPPLAWWEEEQPR